MPAGFMILQSIGLATILGLIYSTLFVRDKRRFLHSSQSNRKGPPAGMMQRSLALHSLMRYGFFMLSMIFILRMQWVDPWIMAGTFLMAFWGGTLWHVSRSYEH